MPYKAWLKLACGLGRGSDSPIVAKNDGQHNHRERRGGTLVVFP